MKGLYFAFACVVFACGNDDEFGVPDPYHGSVPENPRTCGEVRALGQAEDGKLSIDGAPAECVGSNVTCSVDDVPAFDGVCATGSPNATCIANRWVIRCDTDSGTPTPVDGGDGG